jgi:hypothetical protein
MKVVMGSVLAGGGSNWRDSIRVFRKSISRGFLLAARRGLYGVVMASIIAQPVLASAETSFEQEISQIFSSFQTSFEDITVCVAFRSGSGGEAVAQFDLVDEKTGRCPVAQANQMYYSHPISGEKLTDIYRQVSSQRSSSSGNLSERFVNAVGNHVLGELAANLDVACGEGHSGDPSRNGCEDPAPDPEPPGLACVYGCEDWNPLEGTDGPGGGGAGNSSGGAGFRAAKSGIAELTVRDVEGIVDYKKGSHSATKSASTEPLPYRSELIHAVIPASQRASLGVSAFVTAVATDRPEFFQSNSPSQYGVRFLRSADAIQGGFPSSIGSSCSTIGQSFSDGTACVALPAVKRSFPSFILPIGIPVDQINHPMALAIPLIPLAVVGGAALLLYVPTLLNRPALNTSPIQLHIPIQSICTHLEQCRNSALLAGMTGISILSAASYAVRQVSDGLVRRLLYLGKFYSRCLAAIGGACGQACGPDPAAIAWCIANLTGDVPFTRGNPGVPGTGPYHSCTSVAKAIAWPFCR